MTVMKFDLVDGLPKISFTLKPEDAARFVRFMDSCEKAKSEERRMRPELKALREQVRLLQLAEEGAKEAFGVVVQDLQDARKETANLRELLDSAHAQIRRMALRA